MCTGSPDRKSCCDRSSHVLFRRVFLRGQVASRVLTAEEGLRFSKAQLEVMKTEFAAASAQLGAVQTELAQQKAG